MKAKTTIIAAFAAVFAVACETTPPSIDTTGEETFDGLYPVANSKADSAWARPGVDLSNYSKVMLQGAGIEYRPGGETGRVSLNRGSSGPYAVTEEQKERFEKLVVEEFTEEMAKSDVFELVTEPGPDVLLVRGALLDVVSYVPPEPVGRGAVFISKIGEVTLVVEIRDSTTGAIFARAVDRGISEPAGGFSLRQSNRATNAAEVRRVVSHWGSEFRDRLEALMVE
ncbi:MAG: DUF3313 family protein [Pseudomonadota bacterium]